MAKYKLFTLPEISATGLDVESDDVKWEDGFVKFFNAKGNGHELVRAIPQHYVLSVAVV